MIAAPAPDPTSALGLDRPRGLRKVRVGARKAQMRRLALESLEPRTLMAVLPPVTVLSQVDVSNQTTGQESSPSIAVNPTNPQQIVSVWNRIGGNLGGPTQRPIQGRVEGAFTNNGGLTWTPFVAQVPFLSDPSTTNPTLPFQFSSDAGVSYDRDNNFYVVGDQRNTADASGASAGAITLGKFNTAGGSPVRTGASVLYEWGGLQPQLPALLPTVAADGNERSYTDPDTQLVQADRFSGNVYVAWTIYNPAVTPPVAGIQMVGSSDGGLNFTAPINVSDGGIGNTAPQLAVSQGGTGGAQAGQVTVVWDDFDTLKDAIPIPLDVIRSDRVTGVVLRRVAGTQVGPIGDAFDLGTTTPSRAQTTKFTTQVDIADPKFLTVSDLNVDLSILHPNIAELRVRLIPPPSSGLFPITLLDNQVTARGATKPVGASGANLGPPSFQGSIRGTIFDAQALRPITGNAGAGASTGYFRPDAPAPAPPTTPPGPDPANPPLPPLPGEAAPNGNDSPIPFSLLTDVAGLTPAQLKGTWTLEVTDFRATTPAPFQRLNSWGLQFSSGFQPGTDSVVATTTVRGVLTSPFAGASAASPVGIGPAPAIAADNTLGSFSPHQGRLYVAYVDRLDVRLDGARAAGNPADNTDIRLATSDDGGRSWQIANTRVNDDFSPRDGFSGSTQDPREPLSPINPYNQSVTGRAQFQPQVAVDQATGTLVASFLDARNDAARARVATYVGASLDGGATFSPQTFVNAPESAFDEITRQFVALGPIPENARVEPTRGLGYHQGLAVLGGRLYAAYSSNENGGPRGTNSLDVRVAQGAYAGGPRIVSGTMGPVTATTVDGATFNATFAPDGTRQIDAFSVTFDRPVDLRTFTAADVRVVHRLPTDSASSAGTLVDVASVTPLDAAGPAGSPFQATTFLIRFADPQSGTGTYSYSVGPQVRDMIRSTRTTTTVTTTRTVNAASADVPRAIPDLVTITSILDVSGVPVGEAIGDVNVTLSLRHTYDQDLQLTLVAPDGTRILLSQNHGGSGDDYTNTTFDDQAGTPVAFGAAPFTGSFTPDQPLGNLIGKDPNGRWTLEIADQLSIDSGTLDSWSLAIRVGTVTVSTSGTTGNPMDQNANGVVGEAVGDAFAAPRPTGGASFLPPYDPTTLPLIVPGPHVVNASVAGVTDTVDNLVLNATVSTLDVTFDRDMQVSTFTTADVLRILGPIGPIGGPFTVNAIAPAAGLARTFRVGFPTQVLSGSYTIVLGPDILAGNGDKVDANRNAGLDALRGTVDPTTGSTVAVTVGTAVPVPIQAGKTITSTIVVAEDFVIQNLNLRLNITFPNDPDLSAVLVAPDGTRIRLFTRVGSTGTRADFADTIFDDAAVFNNVAVTPIQNGGPPFRGRFNPQEPLSVLVGKPSAGTYTLEITDASGTLGGTLNNWALLFTKPLPGTGLGEPVADRSTVSFRIFTTDPTNTLSTKTWTPVGPASIEDQGSSGRIGGLAIDPSDPSGNTVYVAGASGGVWKTTNFLTDSPVGPTYVPLTDFGPTFAINIGGLAVFGRNGDPNQSIVFAATGEGDTGSPGVGFLRSLDGGSSWTVLDSRFNFDASGGVLPLNSPGRDHVFVGSTSFKVVVDPRPTVTGETIVYAAISGQASSAGIWRSLDTGRTWTRVRAGQATDVVLDPNSGPINAVSNPTGNLQIVYAAFQGEGVYISQNQGTVFSLMTGVVGNPLIRDGGVNPATSIPVNAPAGLPNGPKGRIVLAKPDLVPAGQPNAELQNRLYQGWLYAAVATTDDRLDGLYMTKDFGQNWTKVRIPNIFGTLATRLAIPTNDSTLPDYDIGGGPPFAQANYDIALLVDPTNPNVVYLGGSRDGQQSGLIRVDTTGIADAHAFFLGNDNPDGGLLRANTSDPVQLQAVNPPPSNPLGLPTPTATPIINLIQDPSNPFVANSTVLVSNTARFANSGTDSRWVPYDAVLGGSTDLHRAVAMRDPLTGRARLIFGDDQGVFTALDAGRDGLQVRSIGGVDDVTQSGGNLAVVNGSRNGNLQITQFYDGAAQPSQLAADISVVRGFFYGVAQDDGFPASDPNVLNNGQIAWDGPGDGDGSGVATDQTGTGTLYEYLWPCCGGGGTNFFQVNGVGRTFGLLQQNQPGPTPDPQWPFLSPSYPGGHAFGRFAVNPINGDQIIISSAVGRVFGTTTQGRFWLVIGEPSALDGTAAEATAYGAPDPSDPTGATNSFLYAGTVGGKIFVTFTGGGGAGNNWINLSAGLDGSTVQTIVTNPTRGSREAYAVTLRGVYHMVDSSAPGAAWQNISGNLLSVQHLPFQSAALGFDTQPRDLTSLQIDWRYVVPDDFTRPAGPTHPLLYVGGEGGVYRSLDQGANWSLFPDVALNAAPREGGYLPNAHVNTLSLSLGNVNPTTGRPDVSTGQNILLATTYGRGSFSIRLAPLVFPNTPANGGILHLSTTLPVPPGTSDTGFADVDGVTSSTTPVIEGFSEQSAFGNTVSIALYDVSDFSLAEITSLLAGTPTRQPTRIPLVAGTDRTDSTGRFAVQVGYYDFDPMKPLKPFYRAFDPLNPDAPASGFYDDDPTKPFFGDGPKRILVQATNGSGTKGNFAPLGRLLFNQFDQTGPIQLADPTAYSFILDTASPLAPATPDLRAVSDLGLSRFDDITSVNANLGFDVALSPGEPTTTRVYLVRDADANVVDTKFGTASPGTIILTDRGPVADGVHFYYSYEVDLAGNRGPNSAKLMVTIDTVAPARPNAPSLDPARPAGGSDSGIVGDNITNVRQPFLTGAAEIGGFVEIIDSAGNVLGPALPPPPIPPALPTPIVPNVDPTNGRYSVSPAAPLTDGKYSLRVREQDLAGNFSPPSNPLVVTILRRTPTTPTLALVAADDSGVVGDNITSNTQPRLSGSATAGLAVSLVLDSGTLFDAGGKLVPSGGVITATTATGQPILVAPNGQYLVRFPRPLADGTYVVHSVVSDIAGNFAPSSPLTLTILGGGVVNPTPPPVAGAPVLVLDPRDDSPPLGDNVTTNVQPRFDGSLAAPGGTVQLILDSGTIFGPDGVTPILSGSVVGPPPGPTVVVDANGRFVIQVSARLLGGDYVFHALITSGATTVSSSPLRVTINNRGLATPTLSLSPADNTGIKTDNATVVRRPRFIGTASYPDGSPAANVNIELDDAAGNVLALTTSSTTGGFVISLPNDLVNGAITVIARVRDVAGNAGLASAPLTVQITSVPGDTDGDAQADLDSFSRGNSRFTLSSSVTNTTTIPAGTNPAPYLTVFGDIPLTGDFDGDGKADYGFYRPSNGVWSLYESRSGFVVVPFGVPNQAVPVQADYDGDHVTDLATYNTSTNIWTIFQSKSGIQRTAFFGVKGDVPIPDDFDGDGRADLAFFRPSTAQFYVSFSNGSVTNGGNLAFNPPNASIPLPNVTYGIPGDVPTAADFNGDSRIDVAVFRPRTGEWFVSFSTGGTQGIAFGTPTDVPVPADYDGDGRADFALFRPVNPVTPGQGNWLILGSASVGRIVVAGQANDVPLLAPLQYRMQTATVATRAFVGGTADAPATAAALGRTALNFSAGTTPGAGKAAGQGLTPPPAFASRRRPAQQHEAPKANHPHHAAANGHAHDAALDKLGRFKVKRHPRRPVA